jgi:hypothetical protein
MGIATDARDENLRAKLRGGDGRVKEERKRERLSEATRSILDATDAAIQLKRISSRCHSCSAEWQEEVLDKPMPKAKRE